MSLENELKRINDFLDTMSSEEFRDMLFRNGMEVKQIIREVDEHIKVEDE